MYTHILAATSFNVLGHTLSVGPVTVLALAIIISAIVMISKGSATWWHLLVFMLFGVLANGTISQFSKAVSYVSPNTLTSVGVPAQLAQYAIPVGLAALVIYILFKR